jgi:TolB-like protein/DNA-binding winged helix-turn-helix (wHTH) protein/Tfp pilus assembly protein PilF
MTTHTSTMPETARFGPYQVDLRAGQVRKFGIRIKLGEQPLQILVMLMERPGELVTREELRAKLWSDTFVDFEHSLNSAVQRLREGLSDTAEKAQWVETVPRRGYRFVGQVQWTEPNGSADASAKAPTPTVAVPVAEDVLEEPAVPRPEVLRRFGWRSIAAALALLLVAGGIVAFIHREAVARQVPTIRSLAVLPLENLSGDPSQDYFADGMTDELITALAKNHNLRVVSRTSVMQYKGVQRSVRDIARELGVDGILEGSIERSSNRVHMTVQLIDAPSDTHVWAESYDRDLNQAYSLPEELSQTVAKEVKTATSPAPPQRYINPEAHDAYLQGRFFWFNFKNTQALPYFEKAIQLQPDYAAAWSGLSDTYAIAGMGDRLPQQVSSKALDAARKALELDDSLPEAHNSMAAWYLFYGWDLPRADAELRRAIALNPDYAEAHHLHRKVLMAMNRLDEAEAEEKRAVELDPFARAYGLGGFYTDTRQYDAAINELRIRHAARPTDVNVVWYLSKAYWLKGMYKESQQELEEALQAEHDLEARAAAHKAWVHGGEEAVELWGAESTKARARNSYVAELDFAVAIAYTGDKDQTLKHIEAAYHNRDPYMIELQYEPVFDFLHSDSRYQALVKKIGLQFVP